MLDNKGFDLWADDYDKVVGLSDDDQSYPFAGYKEVLARIYQVIMAKDNATVLDIGFGTGTLTKKLYDQGCEIWGQDFSSKMIEQAAAKMPDAHMFSGDFSNGLVEPLLQQKYDFVVATYSLHHLTDDCKVALIKQVMGLLKERGSILIGDVAFANRHDLEICQSNAGEEWDDEEIYFVYNELQQALPTMQFEPISHCAGVLSMVR